MVIAFLGAMLPACAARFPLLAALAVAMACSNAARDQPEAGRGGVGGASGGAAGLAEGKGGSAAGGAATGGQGGAAGNGGFRNAAGYAYTGEYAGGAGAPVCRGGGRGGSGVPQGIGGGFVSEPLPCQTFPGVPDCPADGPVCGDGVRDTCIRTRTGDRCPRYSFTEPCDGTEGVGAYCSGLGFGSGDVTCTASCTLDISACQECTMVAALSRCGAAPVTSAQPLAMAIAATDAEVALAWAEQDALAAPTLHFARLAPTLDLVATSAIPDAAYTAAYGGLAVPPVLAVAPLPSGWVVAGYAAPELFLHALDAAGQPVARLVVAQLPPAAASGGLPILAARPDGGPLLVWSQAGEVRAAVVAVDGRSTTVPIVLSTASARVVGSPSAIFGRDTFSVAFSVETAPNPGQLRLAQIATDGSLSGIGDALLGTEVSNATLGPSQARGSSDLTVVYQRLADPCVTDQGLALYAQRIGFTGVPLGSPVLVGRSGQYDGWAESAAFGINDASMLLLRETSWHNTLGYGWLKPQGTEFGVSAQIAVDPSSTFRSLHLVRRGDEAVAAWLAPPHPGIRMARLKY
jgi:hypothetical protein